MSSFAESVLFHVIEVHDMMQEIFIDTGNTYAFILGIENTLIDQTNSSANIETDVQSHNLANISEISIQQLLSSLHKAQQWSNTLVNITLEKQSQILATSLKYSNLNLSRVILNLGNNAALLYLHSLNCSVLRNASTDLVLREKFISGAIIIANLSLSESETSIAQAQLLLITAKDDIDRAAVVIQTLPENTFGSGSGSGMPITGSGEMIAELSGNISTLSDGLYALSVAIGNQQYSEIQISTLALQQSGSLLNRYYKFVYFFVFS